MKGSGISALALVLSLLALVFGLSGIVTPESQTLYYVHGTTDASTTSATYVDIPEMGITLNCLTGQSLKVFFTASCSVTSGGGFFRVYLFVRIVKNGSHLVGSLFNLQDLAYPATGVVPVSIHAVDNIASDGVYEYKVQWHVNGYSGANLVASNPSVFHRTFTIEVFS